MMPVKIYLNRVDGLSPRDMIVAAEVSPPMFEGMEEESLACPKCQADVTNGVSVSTLHALFQPSGRLIFHCSCGAHGEIPPPSTAGA